MLDFLFSTVRMLLLQLLLDINPLPGLDLFKLSVQAYAKIDGNPPFLLKSAEELSRVEVAETGQSQTADALMKGWHSRHPLPQMSLYGRC